MGKSTISLVLWPCSIANSLLTRGCHCDQAPDPTGAIPNVGMTWDDHIKLQQSEYWDPYLLYVWSEFSIAKLSQARSECEKAARCLQTDAWVRNRLHRRWYHRPWQGVNGAKEPGALGVLTDPQANHLASEKIGIGNSIIFHPIVNHHFCAIRPSTLWILHDMIAHWHTNLLTGTQRSSPFVSDSHKHFSSWPQPIELINVDIPTMVDKSDKIVISDSTQITSRLITQE